MVLDNWSGWIFVTGGIFFSCLHCLQHCSNIIATLLWSSCAYQQMHEFLTQIWYPQAIFFFFNRPRAFTKGTNVRPQNEAEGLLCQQIKQSYVQLLRLELCSSVLIVPLPPLILKYMYVVTSYLTYDYLHIQFNTINVMYYSIIHINNTCYTYKSM